MRFLQHDGGAGLPRRRLRSHMQFRLRNGRRANAHDSFEMWGLLLTSGHDGHGHRDRGRDHSPPLQY